MMDLAQFLADNGDMGSAAILMFVVAGLLYALRQVNERAKECELDRLGNAEKFGELQGELGALRTKVEVQEEARREHIESLKDLHTGILEVVARDHNHV